MYLNVRYMSKPKQVKLSDGNYVTVDMADSRDIDVDFKVVAWTPIDSNPETRRELLRTVFPLYMQMAPNKRYLFDKFAQELGLTMLVDSRIWEMPPGAPAVGPDGQPIPPASAPDPAVANQSGASGVVAAPPLPPPQAAVAAQAAGQGLTPPP